MRARQACPGVLRRYIGFLIVIAPRIWPGTRAIAQLHLDAGHQVWLVTAAPKEIAELIASRLGITGALGTRAAVVDGCYTGHLERGLLHGPAKVKLLTRMISA